MAVEAVAEPAAAAATTVFIFIQSIKNLINPIEIFTNEAANTIITIN